MIPTAFLSQRGKPFDNLPKILRIFFVFRTKQLYLSTSGVAKDVLLKKLKCGGQTNLESDAHWIAVLEIRDAPMFVKGSETSCSWTKKKERDNSI